MGLSTSQRALAHSASGADGFHHTRPPIKYASRSRGLTQVYVRTQLGGQSLQNGDIAGSSAATRKPGAKVLAKSSSGGFRPRTVPTDPLDGYAIADLPPDAMLAEAAAFARKAAARTAAEHRLYKPPPKREETETEALFASMGAIQARTRHTDDPDDLNPYKGAERRRVRRQYRTLTDTSDIDGAKPRVYQTADGRFLNGEGKPAPRVAVGCEAFFKPLEELDGSARDFAAAAAADPWDALAGVKSAKNLHGDDDTTAARPETAATAELRGLSPQARRKVQLAAERRAVHAAEAAARGGGGGGLARRGYGRMSFDKTMMPPQIETHLDFPGVRLHSKPAGRAPPVPPPPIALREKEAAKRAAYLEEVAADGAREAAQAAVRAAGLAAARDERRRMFEGARRPPDRSSLAPPQPAVPLSRSLSTADVEGAEARGNLKESDPLRIPDRRRQGPKRLTACDDIEGSRPRCRWGVEATLSAQKLGASRSAAALGTGVKVTGA